MSDIIGWICILGLGILIGVGIGGDEARVKRIELMNRAVAKMEQYGVILDRMAPTEAGRLGDLGIPNQRSVGVLTNEKRIDHG